MRDEVEVTGLQPEVLPPPVCRGDDTTVQRGRRRVDGLEHRQRSDVDALHLPPDRVPAEVFGERLNLRQFRHGPGRLPVESAAGVA